MATNAQLVAFSKREAEKLPPDKEHLLTKDMLVRALPARCHNTISSELVEDLNKLIEDTQLRENFRENLLSFGRVMKEGNISLTDYINAVKYVSFKLMGDTNIEAYTKTFPDRYQKMLDKQYDTKTISAHVAGFHKRKTVTMLLEQAMVPSWLINQDLYQKALNVSADLMLNAKSEKVRADAANNLMQQLKMPEAAKVELDVTVKEDDAIAELRKSTMELVAQQKAMINAGVMNAKDIAEQKIISGEYEVIENGSD